MSVLIQTRGEAGGGVAAHLQCPHCGTLSKSHAHQLSHMAEAHPSCLDQVAMGRLGNILMYQSGAQLFHCAQCFFTTRDFTKLYRHIIAEHCTDGKDGGGGGEEEEEEEEEGGKKRKRSSEAEEEEGGKSMLDKKSREEEEEGGEDWLKRSSEETEEGEKGMIERSSKANEKEEGGKDGVRVKRSSEDEEQESVEKKGSIEVKEEERGAADGPAEVKTEEDDGDKSILSFDGSGYRCLICGWRNKLKVVGVNHVVRKHDIPKAYASQAIRHESSTATSNQAAEEEEVAGMSSDMLKEEMKAMAKVVRFMSNRFVCLICGWKTKLKGFAVIHVVRCHDVERPYSCKDCTRSFFLPSRLQQHVSTAHRPGRYACPFCYFRSHFLGGFRRHCSRCNAREEEEGEEKGGRARGGGGGVWGGGLAGGKWGEEEEEEEREGKKERRGGRQRRKTVRMMEAEEEENDEED